MPVFLAAVLWERHGQMIAYQIPMLATMQDGQVRAGAPGGQAFQLPIAAGVHGGYQIFSESAADSLVDGGDFLPGLCSHRHFIVVRIEPLVFGC